MSDKKDKEGTVVLLVLVQGNVSEAVRQEGIRTKGATQSYREGWDNVFGSKSSNTVN